MKTRIKKPLTALMMAWGTYLAIPCPYKVWDDALRPWQIVCLPPVGLIVGGLWALCAALFAHFRFTGLLAAACLTALPFLVTGFSIWTDFSTAATRFYRGATWPRGRRF